MCNKKKVMVRFPNEITHIQIEIDMDKFIPVNEFTDEIFGWYGDVYISIKK